jgi:trigger factor
MRASSEIIEDGKVRLSVDVDQNEVDVALAQAISAIAQQVRIPGFRPGKVPRQVLEARMGGTEALRAEALREVIPNLYAEALSVEFLEPISNPDIDITSGETEGPLSFAAVIEVRPSVQIPGHEGLTVTLPSPVASDEEIDQQINRLRETDAELVDVTRAAANGDLVTIDLHATTEDGTEILGSDDVVYEVGSGRVVPALDEQLVGSEAGRSVTFDAPTPSDETKALHFSLAVKEVKEKKLPALTDEWVKENSEFETIADLRSDLKKRISQVKLAQAQMGFRDAALGALAGLVAEENMPEALIEEEVRQRAHDLQHRLAESKIDLGSFLAATGRSEADLLAELRNEAARSVVVDLALRALVDAQGLLPTEEELNTEIAEMAVRMQMALDEVTERLVTGGRMGVLRSEVAKTKAIAWLLENVSPVDENGAPIDRELLQQAPSFDEHSHDHADHAHEEAE